MRVHITNIYGIGGASKKAQQMVINIAKKNLHYNELGIFHYPMDSDSPEMLRTRLDGILASVSHGDIVIFQFPTWNEIDFDEVFVRQLNMYAGIKKIFFCHDFPPLMFETNRYLMKKTIALLNQADLIILPSQGMKDFLRKEGLKVSKVIIQRMWDSPIAMDVETLPRFERVVSFASDVDIPKFSFAKEWKYESVRMAVTAREAEWGKGKNIEFLGWFNDEKQLADALKKVGGFGLLWSEDEYWKEYMKVNTCSKVGMYFSAGLPIVVHGSIAEADTIARKNLGLVVDSLDEAVAMIENMTEEEYYQMARNVQSYGELVRSGYFTKKLLIDAVFKLLYE